MKTYVAWKEYDDYIDKICDWVDQLQRYQEIPDQQRICV